MQRYRCVKIAIADAKKSKYEARQYHAYRIALFSASMAQPLATHHARSHSARKASLHVPTGPPNAYGAVSVILTANASQLAPCNTAFAEEPVMSSGPCLPCVPTTTRSTPRSSARR